MRPVQGRRGLVPVPDARLSRFVHLHVHSPYSFLDGASPIERLLQRAKDLGMTALALTDHNCLTGVVRFYDKAREMGIKPIIGAEVDVYGCHLTLLAQDLAGYSNLCHLLSEAHLSSPVNRPMANRDVLARYSDGLIALSGCSRGEIPSQVAQGQSAEAREAIDLYKSIYPDRFYIELVYHPSSSGKQLVHRLVELARETSTPVVATNDVHYAEIEEYAAHELLTAIRLITPVDQLPGPRTVEQYLKSAAEMASLFRDVPEAVGNTLDIAERCNLDLPLGVPKFPSFEVPKGHSPQSYLKELTLQGAAQVYGHSIDIISERIEHELRVISLLGFETYFLVVWDIARFARAKGIRFQCRGSAVNSLAVYCLGISNVDPLEHDLLFERFMHEGRREMPDIDIDFQRRRRGEVRDYIAGKYGRDNVAAVATINTFLARSAIRETAKALKMAEEDVKELQQGVRWQSVSDIVERSDTLPELKTNKALHSQAFGDFMRMCASIDGLPRHLSVHLGGLVIGTGDVTDWVPLQRTTGGDVIAQYDKDDIERLGLIKMDILTVPTLDVIEDTVAEVRRTWGMEIDIDSIPRDDPSVFEMHREGDTIGCFQVESPAQREMAGRLLPDCFDDLILLLALVRPGPMKSRMHEKYLKVRHGVTPLTYMDRRLEPVLNETLGQLVYQEQVLKIAHELAGMSYAEADGLRRAMTHDRSREEMEKMHQSFVSKCISNRVSMRNAEQAWEEVSAFAAYGFPKGHAASYAVPAYQTLWLKRYYLPEFIVSVINNQPMGYYPTRTLVQYARWKGIPILPPDVNRSSDLYMVEAGAIRIGLAQLKGISDTALASILSSRGRFGPFKGLEDFIRRTNVPYPTIENLVNVGAFDSICDNRGWLIGKLCSFMNSARNTRDESQLGMFQLAEDEGDLPSGMPYTVMDDNAKRRNELEFLRLPITGHPLDSVRGDLEGITRVKDLKDLPANHPVKLAVWVMRYQAPPTRSGERVIFVCAEDGTGIADIAIFPDAQKRSGEAIFKAGMLLVEGKVQRRGPKALSVVADKVTSL